VGVMTPHTFSERTTDTMGDPLPRLIKSSRRKRKKKGKCQRECLSLVRKKEEDKERQGYVNLKSPSKRIVDLSMLNLKKKNGRALTVLDLACAIK